MHMLKVYHFVFCFCFLLSCSASEQEKISYETNSNEEINTPAFVVADFHTFNLAFFGCEEIKSNRNWNALNDSIYLTVNKMPDSIVVYETRGIENLRLNKTNELSARVKGADSQFLDLVDWRHHYGPTNTLQLNNRIFSMSSDDYLIEAFPNYTGIEKEIKRVEMNLGTDNWSRTKAIGFNLNTVISRTFFEAKAWFNNGDSTRKSIVLHYVN